MNLMSSKERFYFTGQRLALSEHPKFRESFSSRLSNNSTIKLQQSVSKTEQFGINITQ